MITPEIKENLSVVNTARFGVLINNRVIRNIQNFNIVTLGMGVELTLYYFSFANCN